MSDIHIKEIDVNPLDEFWLELPGDNVFEKRSINELCSENPHRQLVELIHTGLLASKGTAKDGLPVYILTAQTGVDK